MSRSATAAIPVPRLSADRVAPAIERVSEILQAVAADERARWILSPSHPSADCELRLSGVVDGELRDVVIDRTFVDAKGERWIVDYKTGSHEGGDLEAFVAQELDRYAPQLRLYRRLARGLGPEPVRCALYFPLLGRFAELPR
ncbi:hypothetical protein EON77_21290 [bacterium]|nr:MAG: hypothetical protein EON77_21290 [bacterium]